MRPKFSTLLKLRRVCCTQVLITPGISFDPGADLSYLTTYYWRVDLKADYDTVPGTDPNTVIGSEGTIEIDGEVAADRGQNLKEPEQRNLGMVFQDLALWPHLTVKGNLEFGLKAQGIPEKQRKDKVIDILKCVHMQSYINSRPGQLSGGQQQRVARASALILHPKALLMDEPFSSLDVELSLQIRKEILKLQEEIGFTLLFVTHNREEAFGIGTRVVMMSHGNIEKTGPVEQIRKYFADLSSF